MNVILRHRYVVIGVPVILAVLVVLASITQPRSYVSTSSFLPQGDDSRSRGAGLAAQFGISLPTGGGVVETPEFYRQLVTSRELLRVVAFARYRVEGPGGDDGGREGTLVELMDLEATAFDQLSHQALDELADRITASVSFESGMVTVRTKASWPEVAEQMNRNILDQVNAFNRERRQTQASAERGFVESRLDEARLELEQAEAELEAFLEQNRGFEDSPQLTLVAARLQRRIDLRQRLYVGLAESYDQARIEEVRNTPVMSVVDQPSLGRPAPRGTVLKGIAALIIGSMLGFAIAFTREHMRREREGQSPEYSTFIGLIRDARDDLVPGRLRDRIRTRHDRTHRSREPEHARSEMEGTAAENVPTREPRPEHLDPV